jgi:hypothetical protein
VNKNEALKGNRKRIFEIKFLPVYQFTLQNSLKFLFASEFFFIIFSYYEKRSKYTSKKNCWFKLKKNLGKFIFWINLELIYENNKKKNFIIYKDICYIIVLPVLSANF